MQRVANDVTHAEKALAETRLRLITAERERLKMQTLADQNAQAILNQTEKRDQRKMDELGVMQFNLRSGS
jgi:flagellar export protein FliJ